MILLVTLHSGADVNDTISGTSGDVNDTISATGDGEVTCS